MGTLEMIVGWIVLSAVVLALFSWLLVRRNFSAKSPLAIGGMSLAVALLGPGVWVAGHFALAIPVGIGMLLHWLSPTPFGMFSFNLQLYLGAVAILVLSGLVFRHFKHHNAHSTPHAP